MASPLSVALQYVDEVRNKLAGDATPAYNDFLRILKQFRGGNIHSSIVVSTVETLFQNHPDLLATFNSYKPRNCSAAAERSEVTGSIDFINRVKLRFRGGRVYSKFLNLMHAYSCQEMSASEVCDKVVGLFGRSDDLVDEFKGFLPQSKKRRIDDRNKNQNQTDFDGKLGMLLRPRKKMRDLNSISNSSSSDSGSSEDGAAVEKPAKTIKDRDYKMEDSMCYIDVKIANLESCRESAVNLTKLLSDGVVTAAEFRMKDHFTALNVACMTKRSRKNRKKRKNWKIVEYLGRDVEHALPQLLQILIKKRDKLEKKRLKIAESWRKLRCRNIIIMH